MTKQEPPFVGGAHNPFYWWILSCN